MCALSFCFMKRMTRMCPQTVKIIRRQMNTDSCGEFRPIKSPNIHALKRGTGGRSSFSGMVATVFGASGFLGRYVCNRLGKVGTQLIIPYGGTHYEVRRLKLVGDLGQVLFQPFRLDDRDTIRKCVQYSNVVINLIGRDWETKNFKYEDVHVTGARCIAEACKEAGVETLVHVSALNAAERPESYLIKGGSQFLRSKWLGEKAVKEVFPDAIIFRPADIYGQEDRFLRYYCGNWRRQMKWMPLYKKGEETEKQPVFVGDVATGIITACQNGNKTKGKIYQAVGPSRYLLSELVDWFYRVIRKSENWGFRRYDIANDPSFNLKVSVMPYLSTNWPIGNIFWDKIEREAYNDRIDPKLLTLEDLGVVPTHMENQVPWELKIFRANSYYDEELGEFEPVVLPKKIKVAASKVDDTDSECSSGSESDSSDEETVNSLIRVKRNLKKDLATQTEEKRNDIRAYLNKLKALVVSKLKGTKLETMNTAIPKEILKAKLSQLKRLIKNKRKSRKK